MVRVVAFFGGKCQSWLCQDKTIPSGIEFIVSISRRERTEMSLLGVDERADTVLLFRWLEAQTHGLEFRRLRFFAMGGRIDRASVFSLVRFSLSPSSRHGQEANVVFR